MPDKEVTTRSYIKQETIHINTVCPERLLLPKQHKHSKTTPCFETNYLRRDLQNSVLSAPPVNTLLTCQQTHFLPQVFCKPLNHIFQLPGGKKGKRTRVSSCWLQYSRECHTSLQLHFKLYIFMHFTEKQVELLPQEGNVRAESDYQGHCLLTIAQNRFQRHAVTNTFIKTISTQCLQPLGYCCHSKLQRKLHLFITYMLTAPHR